MKEMLAVFIQKFSPDTDREKMVGTEENPVYLAGWSEKMEDWGYIADYTDEMAQTFPGIFTPRSLNCDLINIQIGNTYKRGIYTPKEGPTLHHRDEDGKDYYTVKITFWE
jgi:hypothetical protein